MMGHADQQMLEAIRRRGGMTIQQCVQFTAVTPTAVRHRLNRLMAQGLIERISQHVGRGRPRYSYTLTEQAHLMMGQNYADLAQTMWAELKTFEDRAVGMKLLRRVADRLAAQYRRQMPGQNVSERLASLKRLPFVHWFVLTWHEGLEAWAGGRLDFCWTGGSLAEGGGLSV
jgi:predicted ArsR family transcriptional regulator